MACKRGLGPTEQGIRPPAPVPPTPTLVSHQGATVFLDNPKYDGDTVKLIPASELAALAPAAPSPN